MRVRYYRYYLFLLFVILLSIPFYIWGAVAPVAGLPFGLPISFLMIFVPFFLAIVYALKAGGRRSVVELFRGIGDVKRADGWAAAFSILCMPLAVGASFFTMTALSMPLPSSIVIPVKELPLMIVLYFLGAIPEEIGWTGTLTGPLTEAHGTIGTGVLIGSVWAFWHIIPWSWAHPVSWILGMIAMNIVMRIAMVYAWVHGGGSLFLVVIFHTMINVSMEMFPNHGSHTNP